VTRPEFLRVARILTNEAAMWGSKKAEPAPAKPAAPQAPAVVPATPQPAVVPENPMEVTPMNPNDAMRPITPSTASARLGPSIHVKGEITGNEDLHVDGSVEGQIALEDRKLTVGSSAKVTADVSAREIVIYGNVKGNLRAKDRIEIKKDGSVVGDLTTARIMIEDGAYFKGSIEIDRGEGARADKPSLVRAAQSD
jgi:cytoskeletal protein CcmA (bactofilin family)